MTGRSSNSGSTPQFHPPADVKLAFSPHEKINVLLVGGPYHWRTIKDVALEQVEILFADPKSILPTTWEGLDPSALTEPIQVHRYMQWQEFHMPGVGDHPPSFLYKYMETR